LGLQRSALAARLIHGRDPCHFGGLCDTLYRKHGTTCHLLRRKLLYLRFHADSIPSPLTIFSMV
jgi:hypothetical protein